MTASAAGGAGTIFANSRSGVLTVAWSSHQRGRSPSWRGSRGTRPSRTLSPLTASHWERRRWFPHPFPSSLSGRDIRHKQHSWAGKSVKIRPADRPTTKWRKTPVPQTSWLVYGVFGQNTRSRGGSHSGRGLRRGGAGERERERRGRGCGAHVCVCVCGSWPALGCEKKERKVGLGRGGGRGTGRPSPLPGRKKRNGGRPHPARPRRLQHPDRTVAGPARLVTQVAARQLPPRHPATAVGRTSASAPSCYPRQLLSRPVANLRVAILSSHRRPPTPSAETAPPTPSGPDHHGVPAARVPAERAAWPQRVRQRPDARTERAALHMYVQQGAMSLTCYRLPTCHRLLTCYANGGVNL